MTAYEQALIQPRIKKESHYYTERIKKQSVRDAVMNVSQKTIEELRLADTAFRIKFRNVLICMLHERCKMTDREIGYVVNQHHDRVSEILKSEKDNYHKTAMTECFEQYCKLMFERTRVCETQKNKRVYTYVNDNDNDFFLVTTPVK